MLWRKIADSRSIVEIDAPAPAAHTTEIRELNRAFARNQDIRRRNLTVNNLQRTTCSIALVVGVLQSRTHPRHDLHRQWNRHRPTGVLELALDLSQAFAVHPFHRDKRCAVGFAKFKDLDDI